MISSASCHSNLERKKKILSNRLPKKRELNKKEEMCWAALDHLELS